MEDIGAVRQIVRAMSEVMPQLVSPVGKLLKKIFDGDGPPKMGDLSEMLKDCKEHVFRSCVCPGFPRFAS